jgi:hypothetical protein
MPSTVTKLWYRIAFWLKDASGQTTDFADALAVTGAGDATSNT